MAAIGIDLGTTNSCAAVYQDGRAEIITDINDSRLTPSFVGILNDETCIGRVAKQRLSSSDRKNIVYQVKRLIGRNFDEEDVQNDIERLSFEIVEEDKKPMIKVEIKGETKTFSPEEISAKILIYLKDKAREKLDQEVIGVVITVPARFNDAQRRATIDAAKIAQLDVLGLINEPTAAALAYGVKNVKGEKTILVFDLGGGTFDVTIIKIFSKKFEVLATGGDTHLGGEDMTYLLFEHIAEYIKKKHDYNIPENQNVLERLITDSEEAKISLSEFKDIKVPVYVNGKYFEVPVSRATFEHLIDHLLDKTIVTVKQVIKNADLSHKDIDQVCLVGGGTRIPIIAEKLEKVFGGEKINKKPNQDLVVAQGAAMQARLLSKNCPEELKKIKLLDVSSLSLGIAVIEKKMDVIVSRNTKIPFQRKKHFTNSCDNQTTIRIDVYEGDEPLVDDNHFLGSFDVNELPKKRKGKLAVRVCFAINATGILTVTATYKTGKFTKVTKEIAISYAEERWKKKEIEEKIEEIQNDKMRDKIVRDFNETSYKFESFLNSTQKQAEKLFKERSLTIEEKDDIIEKCITMKTWFSSNKDSTTAETLEQEMRKLQSDYPLFFST